LLWGRSAVLVQDVEKVRSGFWGSGGELYIQYCNALADHIFR
jgi:hypothetical protein